MLNTQIGIKRYLYIQTKSFRALGIEITATELNWQTLWMITVPASAFVLILIAMGYYSWENMHDLKLFTEALTPIFQFVLIFFKILICLYKRSRIVALINRIHQLSLQATSTELNILKEENSKDAFLSGIYYGSIMTTFVIAALGPVSTSVVGYLRTGDYKMRPFFQGSYPFEDYDRAPYCFIIYVFTFSGVYFGAFSTLAIETLYSWFMHNIVAHFRILQQQLEHLSENTSAVVLGNWIHYHQQNLTLAEEFNITYGPIVFVQFTLNSIQIVLVAYQLLQVPPLTDFLYLMVFLSAVIIQPTIYCYGGQRVEDESEYTAMTIYKCLDWKSWSKKNRRLMQLPMMRAQKSCKLSGIFFVANFRLYLWVLRTTASYMTLLWSIK